MYGITGSLHQGDMKRKCIESKVAFLWDESFLWGLMAYKTLKALSLPFDLIRSEDIRNGYLKNYNMLFVPGGWASNKLKALGDRGVEEIKRFVYEGGNYFGICGGAGLATMDGLGLLNIKRKPTKERVPSFSGRIYLNIKEHTAFSLQPSAYGLQPIFHAWWPSQFVVGDKDIDILATFGDALPDAYSSDLNVGDIRKNGNWKKLEELYGINLDPERLKGEPAVVEGRFGNGKVLLSLIHFDTLGDENGAKVLINIWEYLGGSYSKALGLRLKAEKTFSLMPTASKKTIAYSLQPSAFKTLLLYCSEIIDFGIRNFLWFWRTPIILQWRRGVRGLEYNTLYVMAKEIAELEKQQSNRVAEQQEIKENNSILIRDYCSTTLLQYCSDFKEKALRLLMLERKAMQRGIITYEYSDNPEIQDLRKELFGNSKSHGGLFKKIIDRVDSFLLIFLDSKLNFSIDNNNELLV